MTLGEPFKSGIIPEECKYINYPSMGFFLYKDKDQNKQCFAISKDSDE